MLSHVIQSLRVMTGEIPMPAEPTPRIVRTAPVRFLLIYVLPFPRGLPTSPVLLERPAYDPGEITERAWQAEVQIFAELLETIGRRATTKDWPPHAAFGTLSGRQWGVLQYRHVDHHFRQFAV